MNTTRIKADGRTTCHDAFTTIVEGVECCKVCYEEVVGTASARTTVSLGTPTATVHLPRTATTRTSAPGAEYLAAALGPREDERRRLFAEAEARREAEQREADRQRAREHHARRRLARGGTR